MPQCIVVVEHVKVHVSTQLCYYMYMYMHVHVHHSIVYTCCVGQHVL